MRSLVQAVTISLLFIASTTALADRNPVATPVANEPTKPPGDKAPAEKCQAHGVKKSICARCNPKLEKVFKAKGDWCEEHKRPESQCVLCHPELAKEGVK